MRVKPGCREKDAPPRTTTASEGSGPLLQRDYWGVIRSCDTDARGVARAVATRFERFPPPQLVRFERVRNERRPLRVGDEMQVHIAAAGRFEVRVIHCDEQSLTVGTLPSHPETGRITFGAYANEAGDVVFHIRSRARSSTRNRYLGFLFAGEPMQTNTWTDFIDRLAADVGDGIIGVIHADSREVEDTPDDAAGAPPRPTFIARGR